MFRVVVWSVYFFFGRSMHTYFSVPLFPVGLIITYRIRAPRACMLLCNTRRWNIDQMSDLRPNKSLLNNTFDGYKLAVDRLSVNSLPLISSVDRTSTNPNKFSYAYVRSHEMRNHLYLDTWSGCVYFVDSDRRINSVHFDEVCCSFYLFIPLYSLG